MLVDNRIVIKPRRDKVFGGNAAAGEDGEEVFGLAVVLLGLLRADGIGALPPAARRRHVQGLSR